MARAIGFRASSNEVFYAVIDGTVDAPSLVTHERLRAPAAYELPDALVWYRNSVMALMNEYAIRSCGVRTAEPLAGMKGASKAGTVRRHNIEGTLMEATRSKGPCVVGPLATIAAKLGAVSAKSYVSGIAFRGLQKWDQLKDEHREAVLAAVAALASVKE